ncbi:putative acyl-CoA-binding protein, ACBP [Helianthus annuus]|nr:putative acyl-CoA-binding protein, ACBP [Helianthus annuus]
MAISDAVEFTQSVVIGLIVSFLLAKLFSIVFSSGNENLISTAGNPSGTLPDVVSLENRRKLAENDKRSEAEVSKKRITGGEQEKKKTVVTGGGGDIDDDWEGVETTELDAAFCAATEFVAAIAADRSVQKVSNDLRLKLYGLYKVATDGACGVPQPSAFKITARAKWNAWHKLGAMSSEEAMKKYLEIITELYPSWADGSTFMRSGGGNNETSSKDTTPMGPDFSSFVHEEEFKLDAIHDYAKEDQTALHSAVGCDQTDVAEILSSGTADINLKDIECQSPLHHAAAVCEPDDTDVKKNAAGSDDDDDGTVYPSDLSSNWQSIQP